MILPPSARKCFVERMWAAVRELLLDHRMRHILLSVIATLAAWSPAPLAPAALASLALVAGCAATSAEAGEDIAEDEAALTGRIPAGTYVLRYGPSGTLSSPLVGQRNVTRLTAGLESAFEAEVLVEKVKTKVNPFAPWLTYRDIEKETVIRRGSMRFGKDDRDRPTVTFGDVGTFRYAIQGTNLTLTATDFNNERRTELRLDPSYQPPAPPEPISLRCVARHVDRGGVVEVTLDRDRNQAGRLKVSRTAGSTLSASDWPTSGEYELEMNETLSGDGWREFDAKATPKPMTIRFPVRELESRRGSFDAVGWYPVGAFLRGDYHLSLRCTHE